VPTTQYIKTFSEFDDLGLVSCYTMWRDNRFWSSAILHYVAG